MHALYYVRVTACVLLWAIVSFSFAPQSNACQDIASCRQAALDAEARQDFEAFHDLAWKAAAKGKPNDPDLMQLIARAQSLSGRPGDALVMLRRLAQMGIAPDAAGEPFRRVRALPGWPDVEALIASVKERRPSVETGAAAAAPPAAPEAKSSAMPAAVAAPTSPAKPGLRAVPLPAPKGMRAAADAVRLTDADVDPVGIAYDSASRRFVLGDRRENRLIVADEVFKRVNALISAGSGGFGALTALEIDRQRGDLWVTSDSGTGTASVHKFQLVSGRALSRIDVPQKWRPAAIGDVAIAENGTVVLLDREGSRLLLLPQPGRAFSRAIALHVQSPSSIAAAGSVAFVSHDGGLVVADLDSGAVRKVRAPDSVTLAGLRRIRWHAGTLIGIQQLENAGRIVRLRLNPSGTSVTASARLDDDTPGEGSALTISGDTAYYVALDDGAPVIRSVPLR